MSQPSPDTRAVVRAVEGLTTQVRRIADAMQTPVVRTEVTADDDATTPATTCSAQHHGFPDDDHRQCIRAAQHHGDHIDEHGFHWSDTVAVYPAVSIDPSSPKDVATYWTPGPVAVAEAAEWARQAGKASATIEALTANAGCAEHPNAGSIGPYCMACTIIPAPAADEDQTLKWTRRESLLVLLTRLQRGRALTEDEARTLRHHVETEMREADTARSVAAGNKRHVQVMHEELEKTHRRAEQLRAGRETWKAKAEEIERDRDNFAEELTREQAASAGLARKIKEQRAALDAVRGALEQAQAAIERAHAAADLWAPKLLPRSEAHRLLTDLRAALDGTEQPTTEEPEPPAGNLAAYQAAIARVVLVLREAREHREQTAPSERQDCIMCGADHFAEIRDAIKGKQPTTEA